MQEQNRLQLSVYPLSSSLSLLSLLSLLPFFSLLLRTSTGCLLSTFLSPSLSYVTDVLVIFCLPTIVFVKNDTSTETFFIFSFRFFHFVIYCHMCVCVRARYHAHGSFTSVSFIVVWNASFPHVLRYKWNERDNTYKIYCLLLVQHTWCVHNDIIRMKMSTILWINLFF